MIKEFVLRYMVNSTRDLLLWGFVCGFVVGFCIANIIINSKQKRNTYKGEKPN